MKKIIIFIIACIIFAGIAYAILSRKSINSYTPDQLLEVFSSEAECNKNTGKTCSFKMCDYIPKRKTLEEVCGKDFKKGWYAN